MSFYVFFLVLVPRLSFWGPRTLRRGEEILMEQGHCGQARAFPGGGSVAFRGFLPRSGAPWQGRHKAVWESHTQKGVSPTCSGPRPMMCPNAVRGRCWAHRTSRACGIAATAPGGLQDTFLSLCVCTEGLHQNQRLLLTQHHSSSTWSLHTWTTGDPEDAPWVPTRVRTAQLSLSQTLAPLAKRT